MKAVLLSERLKRKGWSYKGLALVLPFIAISIAFLLGGPFILESFSLYWWECLFLFALMSLLFLQDRKVEEEAGNFQNIRHNRMAGKIVLAKVFLLAGELVLAIPVLLVCLAFCAWLFSGLVVIDFLRDGTVLLLMILVALWDVPLLYLLAERINTYLLVVMNVVTCFLLAPFLAQTSVWWLLPFTYHYKIGEVLLSLKPSGNLIEGQPPFDGGRLVLAIALSVSLFFILLALLYRKEEKR